MTERREDLHGASLPTRENWEGLQQNLEFLKFARSYSMNSGRDSELVDEGQENDEDMFGFGDAETQVVGVEKTVTQVTEERKKDAKFVEYQL